MGLNFHQLAVRFQGPVTLINFFSRQPLTVLPAAEPRLTDRIGQPYYVRLNQAQALRQMHGMATRLNYEAVWMQFPAAGVWVATAQEFSRGTDADVRAFLPDPTDLGFPDLVCHHIHPNAFGHAHRAAAYADLSDTYHYNDLNKIALALAQWYLAMPSYSTPDQLSDLRGSFARARIYGAGKIKERLVSPLGVFEWQVLDPENRAGYDQLRRMLHGFDQLLSPYQALRQIGRDRLLRFASNDVERAKFVQSTAREIDEECRPAVRAAFYPIGDFK